MCKKILKKNIKLSLIWLLVVITLTACGSAGVPVYQENGNIVVTGAAESVASADPSEAPDPSETSDAILQEQTDVTVAEDPAQQSTEVRPEASAETNIQLMMVGDNLLHMGIVRTGKQADGSYNYDFLFEGIKDFLDTAEIKMINQETIFGGNVLGFSGFPAFNSPTEVGDAIVKAGFNVVLHASNHAADKKIEGLKHCVAYWEQYPEVTMAGIHEEGESPVRLLTIEGIDFAILNYTYGPNLETMPDAIKGHLDMLCDYDEATGKINFTKLHPDVLTDIAKAEEMADVVIVCPHWGTEYTTKPSVYQQQFAMQMAEAGADVIIGTHPHVVQPVEWIEAENGNRALCYYSLGNYVSTQKKPLCMLEAMAWISFRVTEGKVAIDREGTGVLPMVCHYTANPVRLESVYLLEDYTEEKAASHGIKSYGGVDIYLGDLQTWCNEVFGENVLTAEEILGE